MNNFITGRNFFIYCRNLFFSFFYMWGEWVEGGGRRKEENRFYIIIYSLNKKKINYQDKKNIIFFRMYNKKITIFNKLKPKSYYSVIKKLEESGSKQSIERATGSVKSALVLYQGDQRSIFLLPYSLCSFFQNAKKLTASCCKVSLSIQKNCYSLTFLLILLHLYFYKQANPLPLLYKTAKFQSFLWHNLLVSNYALPKPQKGQK